jgi:Putative peptidoglycan binding domain
MAPTVPFPRPLYPPSHAEGPVPDDVDVVAVKRAIARAGFFPWNSFDDTYNENFAMKGVKPFQQANGLSATGNYGEKTHEKLRNTRRKGYPTQWAFDAVSINLMKGAAAPDAPPRPIIPPLGPLSKGGRSVLDQDCTHATSGIPLYPAFDEVWGENKTVIAPEPLVVTRVGGSRPGKAFYADGVSGIRWWFGHLQASPAVGTKFAKGQKIGVTFHPYDVAHVHCGVNVERLWGKGKQLAHHTNYTHGAPRIGTQLAAKNL